MEMMQQWEPLVGAYIKEQMEPSEPIKRPLWRVCGGKGYEREETDKQFVYFQHYHRHRVQTQTV